jgi:hypothetical protein
VSLEEQEIPEPIFEIETPIDLRVRTTQNHWELIISKHPEVTAFIDELKDVLVNPDSIYKSKQDPRVFLFYRKHKKYWLCAVSKKLNGLGFVITFYITDRIKEGDLFWQK